VLRQAKAEAKKVCTNTRATLEKLHAAQAEIGSLLAAIKPCRDALNSQGSESHRFNDGKLDIHELIRIITAGVNPIDDLLQLFDGPREIRARDSLITGEVHARDGMVSGGIPTVAHIRHREPDLQAAQKAMRKQMGIPDLAAEAAQAEVRNRTA
jgi:hypothetical protein